MFRIYTDGEIGAYGTDGNWYELGTYTEERVQEVLNDIAPTKAMFELYKYADNDTREAITETMQMRNLMFDTYEMPKE